MYQKWQHGVKAKLLWNSELKSVKSADVIDLLQNPLQVICKDYKNLDNDMDPE